MPQRRLARDCNPASLVRLVNKPHCPVGAQRKLRSFLLWGDGGNIVCDQQCPPGSLHSECRWDGAFGLGHQRRSHPPHPPRGRPPRLPLPQLPKPLSFQPAQVLSASSVSATAAHTAPVLCAGAPQPPGCPRSSRGAEARSIGRVVPRKCHLGRVTPAGFASVLPLGLQDEIRAKLRPGRRAAAHTAPVLAVLSLLSASLCYRLQPRRQVSPTRTRATWCCVTGLQVHPCCGT